MYAAKYGFLTMYLLQVLRSQEIKIIQPVFNCIYINEEQNIKKSYSFKIDSNFVGFAVMIMKFLLVPSMSFYPDFVLILS